MGKTSQEQLEQALEIRRFTREARRLGLNHALLDALDEIALGAKPDVALGLHTSNGSRPLKSAIVLERKMQAFQGLIAAHQEEGKTRAQALDEIYAGTIEGEKGPFGWTRETAESRASEGKHLRRNPFKFRI